MKKISMILLCGLIILGMTGCGNKTNEFTEEEKEQIVKEIKYIVEHENLQQNMNESEHFNYNSYDATVTNIDYDFDHLSIVFSGKINIKYHDGSTRTTTFNGTSKIKYPSSLYKTEINYGN